MVMPKAEMEENRERGRTRAMTASALEVLGVRGLRNIQAERHSRRPSIDLRVQEEVRPGADLANTP